MPPVFSVASSLEDEIRERLSTGFNGHGIFMASPSVKKFLQIYRGFGMMRQAGSPVWI